MGRRRTANTVKKIHQKEAQGRGQGAGSSYKPGIYTYEIPSKGKVARVKGETTWLWRQRSGLQPIATAGTQTPEDAPY